MALKSYPAGNYKGVNLRKVLAHRIRKLRNTKIGDDLGGRARARADRVAGMIGYDKNKIEKANDSRIRKSPKTPKPAPRSNRADYKKYPHAH
jgi:hypothetical protein